MKKQILLLLSLALIVFGCSKDELVTPDDQATYKNGVASKTIKFNKSTGTGEFSIEYPLLTASIQGSGNASQLGFFTVQNFGQRNMETGEYIDWYGVLTAANGDKIFTQCVLGWTEDGIEYTQYNVLFGTGRFASLTGGEMLLYGTVELIPDPVDPYSGTLAWDLEGEGTLLY